MATIEEDYVSFETAKLLKEKGFNQNCATYYLDGHVWRHYYGEIIPKDKQIYAAPTQAIAMKWLREKCNIHIIIEPATAWFGMAMDGEYRKVYEPRIEEWEFNPPRGHSFPDKKFCGYEEAVEAALRHSLENLI